MVTATYLSFTWENTFIKMLLLCSESHYIPNNQSDAVIMDSYSIYYCITKLYVMLKDTLSRSDFFVMAYYTFLFLH